MMRRFGKSASHNNNHNKEEDPIVLRFDHPHAYSKVIVPCDGSCKVFKKRFWTVNNMVTVDGTSYVFAAYSMEGPAYYDFLRHHLPKHSTMLVDDFDYSTQDLARYLGEVSRNKTLYESYHQWRKLPLPKWFHKKYDFTKVHALCRMCRFIYAKKYGLGWDREAQEIIRS
jgi:hypothetical protein